MPNCLAVDIIKVIGKLASASFCSSSAETELTIWANMVWFSSSSRTVLYSSSVIKNSIDVFVQSKGMECHCLAGFISFMYFVDDRIED